ncbi:MAG: signal peptidase I [Bacilli bacterium]
MLELIEFVKDMFGYIIIIMIIILLRVYVLTTTEIVGDSMEPNLTSGNIILTNQITRRFTELKRFQVIVFKYDNPRYLIKRIIGLPGDHIAYIDNQLYINNKPIKEDFNFQGYITNFDIKDLNYDIIPDNNYFVLGDNRHNSLDSRTIGLISKDKIIGFPFVIVWPPKKVKVIK